MILELKSLCGQLAATNSINEKKSILRTFVDGMNGCRDEFLHLLSTIYDPFKMFGVTSKNCLKRKDLVDTSGRYFRLQPLLNDLESRRVTGHAAIAAVNALVAYWDRDGADVVLHAVDKDLKCRIDAKLINDVFPDLVPQFDVALAKSYDDHVKKVNFTKDRWYASRKLDGIRVICVVEGYGTDKFVRFFSRKGHEFATLAKIAELLRRLPDSEYVLDGEMCLQTSHGEDDFNGIVKLIKRKDYTIENPHYLVFDLLTLAEFRSRQGSRPLSQRLECLDTWAAKNLAGNMLVTPVEQWLVDSDKRFENLRAVAREHGWEGLILRKDLSYEGRRSANMLKVKDFIDAEFVVERIEPGVIGYLDTSLGREVKETMLGKVVIRYKGNEVRVGSGFTIEERQKIWADPTMIVGKTITVQYFEESQDEQGKVSLRFPTVKAIYDGERDV